MTEVDVGRAMSTLDIGSCTYVSSVPTVLGYPESANKTKLTSTVRATL
jgi:hypothetical protein